MSLGLALGLFGCVMAEDGAASDSTEKKSSNTALDDELVEAVDKGDVATVKAILNKGANPDAKRKKDASSVAFQALCWTDPAMLEILLSHGANPEMTDEDGDTLLMGAGGNLAQVKVLIAHGEKVDARNAENGRTALIGASERGSVDVIRFLIQAGADVNAHDKRGDTSLMRANWRGALDRDNADVIRLLIEHGARVDVQNENGTTALMCAAISNSRGMAKALIAAHADLDVHDKKGVTAIFIPIRESYLGMLEMLIEGGADVNASNDGGNTPLMAASRTGADGMVKALLTGGADVDAKNAQGLTALSLATSNGHKETAQMLLSAGADPKSALAAPGSILDGETTQRVEWKDIPDAFEEIRKRTGLKVVLPSYMGEFVKGPFYGVTGIRLNPQGETATVKHLLNTVCSSLGFQWSLDKGESELRLAPSWWRDDARPKDELLRILATSKLDDEKWRDAFFGLLSSKGNFEKAWRVRQKSLSGSMFPTLRAGKPDAVIAHDVVDEEGHKRFFILIRHQIECYPGESRASAYWFDDAGEIVGCDYFCAGYRSNFDGAEVVQTKAAPQPTGIQIKSSAFAKTKVVQKYILTAGGLKLIEVVNEDGTPFPHDIQCGQSRMEPAKPSLLIRSRKSKDF